MSKTQSKLVQLFLQNMPKYCSSFSSKPKEKYIKETKKIEEKKVVQTHRAIDDLHNSRKWTGNWLTDVNDLSLKFSNERKRERDREKSEISQKDRLIGT